MTPAKTFRLGLLGGFRAQVGDSSLTLPKKSQALLAYLALSAGEPQSRVKLCALLWGDRGEENARNSLRQALFAIRRAMDSAMVDALRLEGETVALAVGVIETDVELFRGLVAGRSRSSLEEAARLYRGDLLDGLNLREAAFENWVVGERERLRQQALRAFTDLLAWQRREDDADAAVQTALQILTLDPVQESTHRTLMRIYAGQGNRPAALKQYELCSQVLRRELNVQPEAETKELYRELLEHRLADSSAKDGHAGDRAATLAAPMLPETPPLIDRDREFPLLLDEVKRARNGACRVIAVLGDAGIGKTRLLEELSAEARFEGLALATGNAHSGEQVVPFGLWVSALRRAGVVAQPTLLEGLSPMFQQELARLFPELGRRGRRLSLGSENLARLFEALAQLLGRLAARQPLMIVLEDLHWADPTSVRFIEFLARRLEHHAVCLVLSARVDEVDLQPTLRSVLAQLEQERRMLPVTLSPLSRADTLNLARVLMAPTATPGVARLGEQVWRVSEGNPFVVLEAIRTFQETSERAFVADPATPDRVRRLVLDRIGRLEDAARRLCDAASVLGKGVEPALLRQMTGLDERVAMGAVDALLRRRILRLAGDELDFVHDRIREVAYSVLSAETRRRLHAEAARAIEERHTDDLEPYLATLARHCSEAELWAKAIHYRRLAADQALTRAAYVEAERLLEEALDLVGRLTPGDGRDDVELEVRLRLRVITKLVGEGEQIGKHLEEADRLARSLADDRRLAFVLSEKSHLAWLRGDHHRADAFGRQVLEIGGKIAESPIQGFGHRLIGKSYMSQAMMRPAVEHLRQAVELLPDDGQPDFGLGDARSGTLNWLAISLAFSGAFDEALTLLDDVIASSAAHNDHRQLAWATTFAGAIRVERGELPQAFELLERARNLIATWQIKTVGPWLMPFLGRACSMAGRHPEALRIMERVQPGPYYFGSRLALMKGEVYLAAEMLDDALALAHTSLELARRLGERGAETWAHRLLGEVYTRLGTPEDARAEAHYREGIDLGVEFGVRTDMARARLGLGLLLRRAGRAADARGHLEEAETMLREMGMGYWLARLPG